MSDARDTTFDFLTELLTHAADYGTAILTDYRVTATDRTAAAELLERVRAASYVLDVVSGPGHLDRDGNSLTHYRSRVAHIVDLLANA